MPQPVKVILKPGRAKPFWYGHPWVFSEAIRHVEGEATPGAQVLLCDDKNNPIAKGLYNPLSQIRVRLFGTPSDDLDQPAFWRTQIERALERRRRIGLPNDETDAYRLINAEGDGLSGLTVDCFGGVLSIQSTSIGVWERREMIYDALTSLLSPEAIIEVPSSLPQELEGFSVTPGLRRGKLLAEAWRIKENGLWYWVSPVSSQKTGFYCDQRENRQRLARFSQGKTLLDVYCFSGGFSLNALRQGAKEATLVDASSKALTLAEKNLAENNLKGRLVEADALAFLEQCKERFEIVVLDPPKFAKRAKDKTNALQGYRKLNALGLRVVAPKGLLVSCSCSGLVSEEEFLRALAEASYDAKRIVSVVYTLGAGPDHPLRLPWVEGRYLKCVIAQID